MLVFDCAVGFGVVLLCVCGLLLADYVCLVGSLCCLLSAVLFIVLGLVLFWIFSVCGLCVGTLLW